MPSLLSWKQNIPTTMTVIGVPVGDGNRLSTRPPAGASVRIDGPIP